jgi:hypothetical protein
LHCGAERAANAKPVARVLPAMSNLIRSRLAPLRPDFLTRARTEGLDDLGQPVKRVTAEGGEPCRDVLRRAKTGEELLLGSYSPFSKPGPYREFGPVFILASDPGEARPADSLPIGSDADYLRSQFAVRAYSHEEEIVDALLVDAGEGQNVVDRFFAREDVAFVHVRFPTRGCFAVRLDRA